MSAAPLAVVVLNYRRPDLTIACLESLDAEMAAVPGAVAIVVDNASGDGSERALADAIRERGWGWARLVVSGANRGFAAGNHLGIDAVDARHYLLLNSDTLVRPGALAALLDAAKRHPDAGVIGPRIDDVDGSPQVSCFRAHGFASELMRGAGSGPVSRLLSRSAVPQPLPHEDREYEWVSFAAVLIDARVLAEVRLDEGFFMYFEDVDFCLRARAAGWRVRHAPAARVVHLEGGSSALPESRERRERLPAYFYASRNRYFARHRGRRVGPFLANTAFLAGRAIAALREALGHKAPHTAAREARDNWRGWWSA